MAKQSFIIEEFKKYKVTLFSSNVSSVPEASILISLPSGKAVIQFKSGRLKKNKCVKKGNKKLYEVYVPSSRYLAFIDLLRNEKPLFFYYDLSDNVSYITTSDEPVGEAE